MVGSEGCNQLSRRFTMNLYWALTIEIFVDISELRNTFSLNNSQGQKREKSSLF